MTRRPGIRKLKTVRNHRLFELALADKELNSTAKCVLAVLLFKFQNSKSGLTNPSFEAIGEAIGLNRRSVVPAIAELKAKGWVTAKRGFRESNKYNFAFERIRGNETAPLTGEGDFPNGANREENCRTREGDGPRTTEEPPPYGRGGFAQGARPRAPNGARPRWGASGTQESVSDVFRDLLPEGGAQ